MVYSRNKIVGNAVYFRIFFVELDSLLGGFSLGIGEMLDAFQSEGANPVDKKRMNISLIGLASSYAKVFSRRGGMLSGPQALYGLGFRSFLQT